MSLQHAALAEPKPHIEAESSLTRPPGRDARAVHRARRAAFSDEDQVVQANGRREPDQVASRAHDLVLRGVPAEALPARLPRVRRALRILLQLLLRERRPAAAARQARAAHAALGAKRCAPIALTSTRRSAGCSTATFRTEAAELIELGINHEQQHQELLLTDILSLFAAEPLKPAYRAGEPGVGVRRGGCRSISSRSTAASSTSGHDGDGFAYDNEGPRHEELLRPFKLASRCVTNAEWIEFIEDGGYRTPTLWLADGWDTVKGQDWQGPLYWEEAEGGFMQMSLLGFRPVDPAAPVTHVSYYEADAFARWAGKRLPTEFEWEVAAASLPRRRAARSARTACGRCRRSQAAGLQQMFGDVWEWTASAYLPYPGFKAAPGAVGEYNGKFMCNQFVLRGGSCATPDGHVRRTYRNFFYPHQRWQFMGLRLAG